MHLAHSEVTICNKLMSDYIEVIIKDISGQQSPKKAKLKDSLKFELSKISKDSQDAHNPSPYAQLIGKVYGLEQYKRASPIVVDSFLQV